MSFTASLSACIAVGITLLAAGIDLKTGRIPNWLTVPGLILGLVLGLVAGQLTGLLLALAGALATALVPLLLFKMKAMGGGDVKLFAALGALLGAEAALEIEMAAFMIGAVWGLAVWTQRGLLGSGLLAVAGMALGRLGKRWRTGEKAATAKAVTIRFGPAIGAATLAVISVRVFWG